MAKNVTVQGASYTDVPAVNLPQTGGGTATFTDTSGVTALVSDVASGKIFVDANGVLQTGTASGGGGGAAADFLKALIENSEDLRQYTELPASPTSIGDYAFYRKSNLSLTSLPSGLTDIGNSAFYQCYNLAITVIPDGVTTINTAAFRQCGNLTELTIPASVTNINSNAFLNCTGMTAYHLLPTTPPTLQSTNAFSGIPSGCKIYVPTGCLSAYQSASNWSTYASYMEEE